MKLRDNTDLRSLTLHRKHLLRETKNLKDARPWLMTCRSLTLKRSFQRLHPSSLMDLQSSKASSGRIIPVFSLLTLRKTAVLTLNCKSHKINALCSSSLPCTSLKDSVRNRMESLVFPLIKTQARQSCTIFGHLKTTEL